MSDAMTEVPAASKSLKRSFGFKQFTLLGGDILAASGASLCIAPIVTVVDRSIIKNANGSQPLWQGVRTGFVDMLKAPHRFLRGRDFLLVWGVYTGTYIAANFADTLCTYLNRSSEFPKFLATTVTNISLCVRKDMIFTKMFGVIAPTTFPLTSYALFTLRDCLTIYASFNYPPKISKTIQEYFPKLNKQRSDKLAQLSCPVGIQFISTPIHLFALDLYNRPKIPVGARASLIGSNYFTTVSARISRIFPAFGIGGIVNKSLRDDFIKLIHQKEA